MSAHRNPSIKRRLLWYLVVPVVVLIIVCASLAAKTSSQSIDTIFDEKLKTNAGVLLSFVLYESVEHVDDYEDDDEEMDALLDIAKAIDLDHGLPVNFRLTVGNRTQFVSNITTDFPECSDGFSSVELMRSNNAAQGWRCYRQTLPLLSGDKMATIEIFELESERRQAIRLLVLSSLAPIMLLPLVLGGLTYWAVSWAMASLRKVSSDVSQRSVSNLERLSLQDQPEELLPVAKSVNELLDGIDKSLQREKQFTDDAAHELRTPITSIKMTGQLLRRQNKDPALNDHLDRLDASVNLSSDLIDQLLRFARLQSAKSLTMQSVHLNELLHSELGLLAPQLTASNLAVELTDDLYRSPVQVNESAMALLIRNLLGNAVKFSTPGASVYLTLTNKSLTIEDDGPGIAVEDRQMIFERFYRAPTVKQAPGTGLGLALARWVAQAHGFRLTAETPVRGKGASMVLVFRPGEWTRHGGELPAVG